METLQAINSRRTVRKFKQDPVPRELIEKVLNAGIMAPVGRAEFDSLRITVIQKPVLLKRIAYAAMESMGKMERDPLYGAPVLIVISSRKCDLQHIEYANAAHIAENIMIEATDLGLGSVCLWSAVRGLQSHSRVSMELRLPLGYTPVSAVAIGYADSDLDDRPEHKIEVKFI